MKTSTKVLIVIIIISALGFGVYYKFRWNATTTSNEKEQAVNEISFTSKDITEENYSAKIPIIVGDKAIVAEAKTYIDKRLAEFEQSANKEVPGIREEFGKDNPMANYTLGLDASYEKGKYTESIIIGEYVYTGGANGNSSFKVFTGDIKNNQVLSLSNMVLKDKEIAFTDLVKTELKNWKTEDEERIGLFEDAVDMLTFGSFRNWSLDEKNLIIYFDKYEVGPGVLGAMTLPIPLSKLTGFINENFLK